MKKKTTETMVFLLDVDNTLLDNDTAQADYVAEIRRMVSPQAAQHYWEIFQNLTKELGYADYLGALQQYRLQDQHDPKLLSVASYLLDYDFAAHLYPHVMEVIAHLRKQGDVTILTDGDVIFQPRKIVHAGLWDAVAGKVLICIHKENELHQVERRFPAQHYVIVDDKLRLLAAIKQHWRKRVTTVFVRQGHYAADPMTLADYPPADITLERIDELLNYDTDDFLNASNTVQKQQGA